MAKVNVSDLFSANSSYMVTCLEDANNNIKKITSLIQSFNSNSTNELIGGGYDAVRAKMAFYIDSLEKLSMICTNLISAIPNANNTLINFMEGYSELDDSKIPEVESELKRAKAYLAWLKSSHVETDDEGNERYVRNGTDAEIADCEALIAKLEDLLEKLRMLAPTDASAYSNIEAVEADISAYANALLQIKLPNFDGTIPTESTSTIAETIEGTSSPKTGPRQYFSFDQKDGRWQNSGYRSVEGSDVASGGCSVCSTAACLATIMQDSSITPYTVGKIMGENGWNNKGGDFVGYLGSYYGLDTDLHLGGASDRETALKNLVENGGAAVIGYKGGGHYVAVIGYDGTTNEFIVADSYPSVAGYNDNLYQIGFDELYRNTKNPDTNIGSMWMAIAPKGMSVQEAIR